jgi:hypothetical protein
MSIEDSQEGITTQELSKEDTEFINKFRRISAEVVLRQFEKKYRDDIGKASASVKDAFDNVWKKVTKVGPYFQPITTVPKTAISLRHNDVERSDPKSRNYRAIVRFSRINWMMHRLKIRKRFWDFFNLKGIVSETERERVIYHNLRAVRLAQILGKENAGDNSVGGPNPCDEAARSCNCAGILPGSR